MWKDGVELWCSSKPANIQRNRSFHSEVLRTILNAPWYVSNYHNNLDIPEVIKYKFLIFLNSLSFHPDPLPQALSSTHLPTTSTFPEMAQGSFPISAVRVTWNVNDEK